ncbi:MAG: hypothetical protein AAB949_01840 [Patescibacteria group bacterium]
MIQASLKLKIMKEKFDPKDEQYKEVADLPPEHQEEFMDVKGGGFVSREVIINPERAKKEAHKEYKEKKTEQEIEEKKKMLLPIIKRFRAGLEKLDLIDHAGWFDNHEGEPHKRVRVLLKDGSEFKGYHGYDLFESEENGYEAFYVIGSHVAWANTGGIVVFEDGRRDIPIQDIKKITRLDHNTSIEFEENESLG